MRFEKLRLTNWGPFRGSHEISLSVTEGSPVVVIFGENTLGKTSLAKAIRWGLHGSQSGVDGAAFANWFALSESDDPIEVEVRLWLSREDPTQIDSSDPVRLSYELSRSFKARRNSKGKSLPSVSDSKCSLLRSDGNFVDQPEIWVSRQLPPEISRFLIFDGEDLKKLTEELEKKEISAVVRDGIDSVMGIPALKALEELIQSERKKVDRSLKIAKEHQGSLEAYNEAVRQREIREADLVERQRELRAQELERNKTLTEMQAKKEFSDQIAQRRILERQRSASVAKVSAAQEAIKQMMGQSWWLPLANWIELSKKRELRNREQFREREERIARLRSLESIGKDDRCPTCKQHATLGEQERSELSDIRRWLNENQGSAILQDGFESRFSQPQVQLERLRNLLIDERAANFEISELDRELKRIEVLMADVVEDEIDALVPKLSRIEQYIGTLTSQIERLEREDIPTLRAKEAEKRKAIRKLGAVPGDEDNYSAALEQLQEVVSGVRSGFRDQVREEVERVASQHFTGMTRNEDLIGLEITPEFKLGVIHRALDEVKPQVSAGQMLMMVYSFVGALIEVSSVNGAWILDTPMARLDEGNMHAAWDWLCDRKRQVIVLPHSRELSKAESTRILAGRASRKYEIVRAVRKDSDAKFVEIVL